MSGNKYALPDRKTRGKRLREAIEDEEREADDAFWGQEFFSEEQKDDDYVTESEREDVVDSDFSAPEDDEDDEEVEEPEEREKKKKLLPPGAKRKTRPSKKSTQVKASKDKTDEKSEKVEKTRAKKVGFGEDDDGDEDDDEDDPQVTPPVLRNSTIQRRAEAEQERMRQEKIRSKRKRVETNDKYKPLTQAEMLKEAAQTEIKNLESLQQLVAMEEETKKKSMPKKTKYMGPLIRVRSRKVGDGEKESTSSKDGNRQAREADVDNVNKELDDFFGVEFAPRSASTDMHSSILNSLTNQHSKLGSKNDAMDDSNSQSNAKLTHVNEQGDAKMVDTSNKSDTVRIAIASARVLLGQEAFLEVKKNNIKKGDVLKVAQLAGIMGAKQTAQLIPLCHTLNLRKVDVDLKLDEGCHGVLITALAKTVGQTGVEMEALMAASISALTVYDMCKAVSKSIVITDVRLEHKSGGKSGDYNR